MGRRVPAAPPASASGGTRPPAGWRTTAASAGRCTARRSRRAWTPPPTASTVRTQSGRVLGHVLLHERRLARAAPGSPTAAGPPAPGGSGRAPRRGSRPGRAWSPRRRRTAAGRGWSARPRPAPRSRPCRQPPTCRSPGEPDLRSPPAPADERRVARNCASCRKLAPVRRRLAEVAKKVGVSEATVSRVLNGKPGVSEATREAVLTALDVLGYERPTQLRGERARLVGLVLPELQNPIFPAFAEVVGGALAQQGFTPVLCTRTAGGVSEADYVEMLLEQQVSGVVFAGGLLRPGRRAARALPPAARARAAGRAGQRRPSTTSASRGCPATTRSRSEQAFGHLRLARPRAHRPGARPAPTTCPSRRKLAAFQAARSAAGCRPTTRSSTRMFSMEGGHAAAAPADHERASPASSAPATCWRSARSGPPAAPAWRCRRTSRWSATTTRRS